MLRVRGKIIKTKQHLNFLAAQNTALSNIIAWSFTKLQDSKNFWIFSGMMYFVGFLINPTDINRAVPPKNWACAVPQLWAALRDAPSHQPHSYTTLRKLQLNTMNFLPSIPVPSVNLSPCVFTLLDFTGSKKLHQLNSNIKVFDS